MLSYRKDIMLYNTLYFSRSLSFKTLYPGHYQAELYTYTSSKTSFTPAAVLHRIDHSDQVRILLNPMASLKSHRNQICFRLCVLRKIYWALTLYIDMHDIKLYLIYLAKRISAAN